MTLNFLLFSLLLSTALYSSTYQYSINITLVNMDDALSPEVPKTPYFYLLNQNIFPNTTYQTVILKEVFFDRLPAKFSTSVDSDGNPMITIFPSKSLGAYENATVSMTFIISISGKSFDLSGVGNISEIPKELSDKYPLTGLWDLSKIPNSDEILSVANSLKGEDENALHIIINILTWFEENLKYNPDLKAPQDLWTTFSTKSGDCDDQSNLFVFFCRALGIPAYTVLGPVYLNGLKDLQEDNNMIFNLTNVAWHGWVMVYLPTNTGGAWFPVDLTFFKDAYLENGHIKSRNPLDHITGSAFSQWDSLEYLLFKSTDYITEIISVRNNIISSDVIWIETHLMLPTSDGTAASQPLMTDLIFFTIFVATIVVILWIRRKFRSTPPQRVLSSP